MEVVLDASVVVAALTADEDKGWALQDRLAEDVCFAPHLVDAEVGSVLRRRVAAGAMDEVSALAALLRLPPMITERFSHGPLAASAWRLRHNLSYYDALYVALAARLDVSLLTVDKRLANAPSLPCTVEVIS